MKLLTVVISILQVVLVKSLGEVSGYLGDTITLRSGVDPAWNLSKIEWSIFSNHTWIATYRKGRKSTERVPRYAGRLSLDIYSGDLTIQNLTKKDATEYTVDLLNTDDEEKVNKIKLIVRERFQTPEIQADTSPPVKGQCLMVLDCSSPDNGVNYSWNVTPASVHTTSRSSARLVAFLRTSENSVNFTCTTSNSIDHASSVATLKCDDGKILPPTEPTWTPPRERFAFYFLIGFLTGAFTVIIVHCFREHIKAAFQRLKEKLCSSNKCVV